MERGTTGPRPEAEADVFRRAAVETLFEWIEAHLNAVADLS
jgi:hypothetical protein